MPPKRDCHVERAVILYIGGVDISNAIKKSGASCTPRNIFAIVKRRGLVRTSCSNILIEQPAPPPSPPKPTVATSKRRLSNKRDAAGAARKKRVNAKSYRLTPAQKNKELIAKKKKDEAFSKAFKECTAAAAEVKSGKQLRDIISTAAQKAGLSPSAAPKERRIRAYVLRGAIGTSPQKGAPKTKYPKELFAAAAAKASLSQVLPPIRLFSRS